MDSYCICAILAFSYQAYFTCITTSSLCQNSLPFEDCYFIVCIGHFGIFPFIHQGKLALFPFGDREQYYEHWLQVISLNPCFYSLGVYSQKCSSWLILFVVFFGKRESQCFLSLSLYHLCCLTYPCIPATVNGYRKTLTSASFNSWTKTNRGQEWRFAQDYPSFSNVSPCL